MEKIGIAVVCISDRSAAGLRADVSGPAITEALCDIAETLIYTIIPDEREKIKCALQKSCHTPGVGVVLTTGGTGLAPRDVTPEATLDIAERLVPGIAEEIRRQSLLHTPNAMLSRAVSVVCNGRLVVNLPGSPKAVRECCAVLKPILCHATQLLAGEKADG